MPNDEQAIRDVIAHWHSATNASDVEAVLRLMAEDVTFLVTGQPPMQGRAAFEAELRGLLVSHRIQSKGVVQEVRVSGDLAYAWTLLDVRIEPTDGGKTVVRSGSALSIFRKLEGKWVLVRDANLLTVVG